MAYRTSGHDKAAVDLRSSLLATIVIGVALMAAIDEIVFHQILRWHHFYDRSTPVVGLISDGVLHAAELVGLIGGFFWLAGVRRRGALGFTAACSGLLSGAGFFQLFDGLVDHKLLRLHQVRAAANDMLPYDIAWNAAGAVLLLCGAVMFRRAWADHARR